MYAVTNKRRRLELPTADTSQDLPYSSPLLTILNRDTHYETFQSVRQHLSVSSIISLSRVCKQFSNSYRYLHPQDWDIDQHLSRFIKHPAGFRSEMAKSGALITADVATEFFERTIWQDSKLVIFVQDGEPTSGLLRHIQSAEPYVERSYCTMDDRVVDVVRVG